MGAVEVLAVGELRSAVAGRAHAAEPHIRYSPPPLKGALPNPLMTTQEHI
jgi:hypothetical protein